MTTIIYFIIILLSIFLFFILLYEFLTRRYTSPYTLQVIFGKKGVGKSCSMQKDLTKHYKKKWHCYADSNTHLPFVKKIDAKTIYNIEFPRNSIVCIDEVNLLWDNRDYKSMDPRIIAWFRQQRKFGVKVIMYSQTFDCDKKLRDLADMLAIQKKLFRVFSIRRYYFKTPRIISAEEARDTARICDDYVKLPWYSKGVDITFIPKWVKKYDTNEINDKR